MKNAPYTLIEAEKIHSKYQSLIGQKFDNDSDDLIDCVAIAPFDEVSKNRFTIFYLLFDDAEMALNHEYRGFLYDVMVVAGTSETGDARFKSLNLWLAEQAQLAEEDAELAFSETRR